MPEMKNGPRPMSRLAEQPNSPEQAARVHAVRDRAENAARTLTQGDATGREAALADLKAAREDLSSLVKKLSGLRGGKAIILDKNFSVLNFTAEVDALHAYYTADRIIRSVSGGAGTPPELYLRTLIPDQVRSDFLLRRFSDTEDRSDWTRGRQERFDHLYLRLRGIKLTDQAPISREDGLRGLSDLIEEVDSDRRIRIESLTSRPGEQDERYQSSKEFGDAEPALLDFYYTLASEDPASVDRPVSAPPPVEAAPQATVPRQLEAPAKVEVPASAPADIGWQTRWESVKKYDSLENPNLEDIAKNAGQIFVSMTLDEVKKEFDIPKNPEFTQTKLNRDYEWPGKMPCEDLRRIYYYWISKLKDGTGTTVVRYDDQYWLFIRGGGGSDSGGRPFFKAFIGRLIKKR